MAKLGTVGRAAIVVAMAMTVRADVYVNESDGSSNMQGISSGSGSIGEVAVLERAYQIADVSGDQACGGEGFDCSRYWVGPLPNGNDTALTCVSGYHCEAQGSGPIFWCKQFALPVNDNCGGYMFYTLFKCVEGTACTIDKASYEPRCLPLKAV